MLQYYLRPAQLDLTCAAAAAAVVVAEVAVAAAPVVAVVLIVGTVYLETSLELLWAPDKLYVDL
jgi:hypothetical protein